MDKIKKSNEQKLKVLYYHFDLVVDNLEKTIQEHSHSKDTSGYSSSSNYLKVAKEIESISFQLSEMSAAIKKNESIFNSLNSLEEILEDFENK